MTSKQLSNAKEEIKMKEAENPVAIYSTAHNAHHFKVRDRQEGVATANVLS